MSQAADPRAKLSRAAVRWALTGVVVHHVTVARVAQALGMGRVQLSVYPSFCLKGLMHDE